MNQSFLSDRGSGQAPRAKICGVTAGAEASAIAEMGADALGFNFWPGSKRHLARTPEVDGWLRDLAGIVFRVGVFVNARRDEIVSAIGDGVIDLAQLHGDETPAEVNGLFQDGVPVVKAMGVKDAAALEAVPAYRGTEDAILLDAYAPVEYGGTGETMDWNLGREAVERWPGRKIILAGGLDPENVGAAIGQVKPFAVDVASGVESGVPGRKDLERVRRFLEAVRGAI